MKFCAAINCMDGRVQLPVIHFMRNRLDGCWVDMITEAGPNLVLAEHKDEGSINSILRRLDISVHKHGSTLAAIVGHYDCAGNLACKDDQFTHIKQAVEFLKPKYPGVEFIGVWVDKNWHAWEVDLETMKIIDNAE